MVEFFRHCPECGKRFHIKLEERKMVHLERRTLQWTSAVPPGTITVRQATPSVVYTGAPVTLDIEDFDYTYKCGHCGHEWTEHRHEEHKER